VRAFESEERADREVDMPGSEGIWIFIFIDMMIFLLIFLVFMLERMGNYELYVQSQLQLSAGWGFTNTLILLTSSWMVVEAVRSAKESHTQAASRWLKLAFIFGGFFVVSKTTEYYLKIDSGVGITTNSFFTFYFFITAIHFLHLLVGMVLLWTYSKSKRENKVTPRDIMELENVGLFWHFVDALWIFIFPILYLI
jgi:nitric oxide reductase NorE protein|tara:strand:- start:3120 stop:3707 length:588 start_codon:yes stop_codon:yes gene_type:complete